MHSLQSWNIEVGDYFVFQVSGSSIPNVIIAGFLHLISENWMCLWFSSRGWPTDIWRRYTFAEKMKILLSKLRITSDRCTICETRLVSADREPMLHQINLNWCIYWQSDTKNTDTHKDNWSGWQSVHPFDTLSLPELKGCNFQLHCSGWVK